MTTDEMESKKESRNIVQALLFWPIILILAIMWPGIVLFVWLFVPGGRFTLVNWIKDNNE